MNLNKITEVSFLRWHFETGYCCRTIPQVSLWFFALSSWASWNMGAQGKRKVNYTWRVTDQNAGWREREWWAIPPSCHCGSDAAGQNKNLHQKSTDGSSPRQGPHAHRRSRGLKKVSASREDCSSSKEWARCRRTCSERERVGVFSRNPRSPPWSRDLCNRSPASSADHEILSVSGYCWTPKAVATPRTRQGYCTPDPAIN